MDLEMLQACNYRCPMCPMSGAGAGGEERKGGAGAGSDKSGGGEEGKSDSRGEEGEREGGGEAGGGAEKRGASGFPEDLKEPRARRASLRLPEICRIISEGAARGQRALGFGGLWEPLMFRGLPEVVSFARERGIIDLILSTNGSLLTRELSRELIAAGLTRLMVSLDAAGAETYRLMRPGGELAPVEENIRVFLEERKRSGKRLPLLRLSFLVTSLNEAELPAFASRWRGLADYFSVQRYGFYRGKSRLALFPQRGVSPPAKFAVCEQPFKRMSVRHNGDAVLCCDLSGAGMPAGNIRSSSLAEIWGGPFAASLRESLKSRKTLNSVCRACQSKYAPRARRLK
jgi:radical SAM protein with 4Fe4S-binding SPASM domain